MQLVAPRAVSIAVAMLATSCTIHFRVSFLVMIILLSPFITFILYPLSFIIYNQLPVSKPPLPMSLPFLVNTFVGLTELDLLFNSFYFKCHNSKI